MPWAAAALGIGTAIIGRNDSQPSGQQTTTTAPPAYALPNLQDISNQAADLYGQRGQQPAYPDYSTVAPFTQGQQAGIQGGLDYAQNQLSPYAQQAQQANMAGFSPYANPIYQAYQGGLNPAIQNLTGYAGQSVGGPDATGAVNQMLTGQPNMDVYGPIMDQIAQSGARQFSEQVNPAIRADFGQGHGLGGGRHQIASGLALDRINENVLQSMERVGQQASSEALGQQRYGAGMAEQMRGQRVGEGMQASNALLGGIGNIYGTGVQSANQNLALAPQLGQFGGSPYEAMMQYGGAQQQQNQAQLSDDAARFYAERDFATQNLGDFANLQSGITQGGQSTQPIYQPNPLMSGIGAGLTAYSAFNQQPQQQGNFYGNNQFGALNDAYTSAIWS